MTTMDTAPDVILQLCNVAIHKKTKCTILRCNCKSNKLFCTELYSCGTEDESCIKLMLDDQRIDEDSCKSFTDDM